ncbi:MAG: hypothetical protein WAK91_11350 [Candidatus Acidiferrales bacterium]|jgi:hypothetical protein
MLSTLREIWSRLTTSRYTAALTAENARLRAENRALLNSILGIAGIPPLRVDVGIERQRRRDLQIAANVRKAGPSAAVYASRPVRDDESYDSQPGNNADDGRDSTAANSGLSASQYDSSASHIDRGARSRGLIAPANPLRRRSWQQIGRMLEIEDARRRNNRDNSDSML